MKKRHFREPKDIIAQKRREVSLINSAGKANMILTLCVLHDCFGFGKIRINRFMDRYNELLMSYNEGNENLDEINEELWRRFGLKIM